MPNPFSTLLSLAGTTPGALRHEAGVLVADVAGRTALRRTAAAVVALVVLLVAAHCALAGLSRAGLGWAGTLWDTRLFNLGADRMLPEWVEYGLLALGAAALLRAFAAGRAAIHLVLALILLAMAADNALSLHEAAGRALMGEVDQFRGEALLILGVAALLGALVLAALRLSPAADRPGAVLVIAAIGLVLPFGVAVDFLHTLIQPLGFDWLLEAMVVVEDGGELAVIALVAVLSFAVGRRAAERADGMTFVRGLQPGE